MMSGNNRYGKKVKTNSFGKEIKTDNFGRDIKTNSFGKKIETDNFGKEVKRNFFGSKIEEPFFKKKKVINKFEDRIKNPNNELIDFSQMVTDKTLTQREVTEKFLVDEDFRREVKRELQNNIIFRTRFIKHFPKIYEEITNQKEAKKSHLSK